MTIQELFSRSLRWTKGRDACDLQGFLRGPTDSRAQCWCLRGAVFKCYADPTLGFEPPAINDKMREVVTKLTATICEIYPDFKEDEPTADKPSWTRLTGPITSFNDERTTRWQDIIAIVQLADV